MRHGVQGDLIDVLATDHLVIQEIFSRLENAPADADERRRLMDEVAGELRRHSAVKEELLYPLLRDLLPHGEALVAKELLEHQESERLLLHLETLSPGQPQFDEALSTLIGSVREQIAHEEKVLHGDLAAHCDPEKLRWYGTQAAEVKQKVAARRSPGGEDGLEGEALGSAPAV